MRVGPSSGRSPRPVWVMAQLKHGPVSLCDTRSSHSQHWPRGGTNIHTLRPDDSSSRVPVHTYVFVGLKLSPCFQTVRVAQPWGLPGSLRQPQAFGPCGCCGSQQPRRRGVRESSAQRAVGKRIAVCHECPGGSERDGGQADLRFLRRLAGPCQCAHKLTVFKFVGCTSMKDGFRTHLIASSVSWDACLETAPPWTTAPLDI